MLYFLLLIASIIIFIQLYKIIELKDRLKETKPIVTDEDMLEVAKKYGNKAELNNINQAALNIWYNWLLRQVELLKSDKIKFNIID